ncbi:electron transfer flavoprotein subunit beta/FixA family protein [Brenneria izadpanahii]|uniref:Electron transfer flavoprotein subunit beta/FixA family protein n=1 Tax=Brenneria izadpanahii TaxID=2722756 RepID=A0ABX7UZA9_9GAMM|nr:electron transfer flavoprotein subunit beta/FixA family protein [Brenneria izadpanahii]QTF08988.1 electron transfer flavoprotein subunit beta/FixA family protein [Brenneria izadpanahii]
MPKFLVLYKWTLNEQDIKIRPDDLSLDASRAKGKISDFDRNAIEEAAQIVEAQGGSVDVLTYGAESLKSSLKDVLSRGADKAYWIADASAETADATVTAKVLAAAIRKIGPYDIILTGEGSSDQFNQQTAPRLAALLGLPCLTLIHKLDVDGETVSVTRKLTDCTEQVTVNGPVVISVLSDINKPRIPGLKQVLGAAKKPNEEIALDSLGLSPADLQPKAVRRSVKGFVMTRKNVVFKDADPADAVGKLVTSLVSEGLI